MARLQMSPWCFVVLQCLILNSLSSTKGASDAEDQFYDIPALCAEGRVSNWYSTDTAVIKYGGECAVSHLLSQKFMLRLEKLVLRCGERIDIFRGAFYLYGPPIAHLSCMNKTADFGPFILDTQVITLKFTTKGTKPINGFQIVLTAIQDSTDGCKGFVCGNSVCVSERLKCDGKNDCGDNSDESDCDGRCLLSMNSSVPPLLQKLCVGKHISTNQ